MIDTKYGFYVPGHGYISEIQYNPRGDRMWAIRFIQGPNLEAYSLAGFNDKITCEKYLSIPGMFDDYPNIEIVEYHLTVVPVHL